MGIKKSISFKGIELKDSYSKTVYFATNFNGSGEVKVSTFANENEIEPISNFETVPVEFTEKELDDINKIVYGAVSRTEKFKEGEEV